MITTILAIDLGKYNSVVCWYEPDTQSAAFPTVKTTPDDLKKLNDQEKEIDTLTAKQ